MFFEFIKRTIDFTSAIILIIIFSPIMLLTAIIIKITSPGPILVEGTNKTAQRVGKNAKVFYHFKFRSMMVNAYEIIKNHPKYINTINSKEQGEWRYQLRSLNDDERYIILDVLLFNLFVNKQ